MSVPNRAEHPRRKMTTIDGYIAPSELQEGERVTGATYKLAHKGGKDLGSASHEVGTHEQYQGLTKHYLGGNHAESMKTNIMTHRDASEINSTPSGTIGQGLRGMPRRG